MTTKLMDQILGAGIIPENAVKQMEQWQTMPSGSANKVGEFSPKKVQQLKEDLELQRLPTLRETVLDADKLIKKGRHVAMFNETAKCNVWVGVDILGRYLVEIPRDDSYDLIAPLMRPMTIVFDHVLAVPRNRRMINAVSVLYETIEDQISVPAYWFCETAAQGENNIVRGRRRR